MALVEGKELYKEIDFLKFRTEFPILNEHRFAVIYINITLRTHEMHKFVSKDVMLICRKIIPANNHPYSLVSWWDYVICYPSMSMCNFIIIYHTIADSYLKCVSINNRNQKPMQKFKINKKITESTFSIVNKQNR